MQETHSQSSALTDLSQSGPTTKNAWRLAEILWLLPAAAMIGIIKLYRLVLSPWIGNQCRFHPTCSHYGEEAIRAHGAVRGSWLILRRLSKCHPWHEGGCDPVPPSKPNS